VLDAPDLDVGQGSLDPGEVLDAQGLDVGQGSLDLGVDPDEPDLDAVPARVDADASGTEERVVPDVADSGPGVDTDNAEPGDVRRTEAESDEPDA